MASRTECSLLLSFPDYFLVTYNIVNACSAKRSDQKLGLWNPESRRGLMISGQSMEPPLEVAIASVLEAMISSPRAADVKLEEDLGLRNFCSQKRLILVGNIMQFTILYY